MTFGGCDVTRSIQTYCKSSGKSSSKKAMINPYLPCITQYGNDTLQNGGCEKNLMVASMFDAQTPMEIPRNKLFLGVCD